MICFGLLLCSARSCHVFGRKRFLLYLQQTLCDWRWGLDRSRHVLLHVFVVWQVAKWFGDHTRFLENHTLDVPLFWPFSGEAISLTQVSCWQPAFLALVPWSLTQCLGSLCRGAEKEWWRFILLLPAPVSSFLSPLCLSLSQWWHQSYNFLYSLIYPPSRTLIIGT